MSHVLSTMVSAISLTATVVSIDKGLTTYSDLTDEVAELNESEFRLHQCGAFLAAAENITLAAAHLTTFEAYEGIVWNDVAGRIVDDLEASATADACAEGALYLHAESADTTPKGWPNVIYRLSWYGRGMSHG